MSYLKTRILQSREATSRRGPAPVLALPKAEAHSAFRLLTAATLMVAAAIAFAQPSFARGTPESFADLAEKLLPAVVNVSSEQEVKRSGPFPEEFMEKFGRGRDDEPPRHAQSLGSGFIVDGTKGIVITNNHVIEDSQEIKVILQDDTEYTATLVGTDPSTDVAVLKIDTDGKTLPEVPWGDSDKSRVGDWVMAIGNPLGLGGTVTAGIISARGRNIQSGPYDDYIQTDASINRGNSGGPLFNMDGEVVGINTAIFSQTGGSIGIGFSIPSNQAANVADQILKYGSTRRGWLGVSIQEVTDDIADSLGLAKAEGALISTVHEGGPAQTAGFEAGDIILSFGGKPVHDTRELLRLVANASVDEAVEVEVWRDGKTITLNPTLGQREKIDLAALSGEGTIEQGKGSVSRLDSLGVEISPLSEALIQEYNLNANEGGVVITDIAKDSDAADKDLRPGDMVLEVNQNPVSTPADVEKEVTTAMDAGRSSVLLKVLRGDRKIFVAVRFAR
ncbi:DegQ family serine endoprotease [Rhodospirillaceae bacterium KN72]|uniref:Probable periplasmic serine endoprotease DegP-like n=1 Tax=Pacificispira spongiicola TaxID=2729598 RepID=A0A7Y0E0Q4_9PROT|nr:DegQ family serine endoprotease [Pacificispira spongiicola]NMM45090.1 DegQ family serine endoprotease [Pacificispira spongiicola]